MLKNKKGFTLIEIVIVIVIIAILAAILVPNLTRWVEKAKLATIKSEADTVRNAVVAQLTEEMKDGNNIAGKTQNDFDDDFWTALQESTNAKLQYADPDKNGYVAFSIGESSLSTFVYGKSGYTATYDVSGWSYE